MLDYKIIMYGGLACLLTVIEIITSLDKGTQPFVVCDG